MNSSTTSPPAQATGSRSAFVHDLETRASPEAVWRVWTEVAAWPSWDTELESARLDGSFLAGARGILKGKGSPEAKFVIDAVETGRRYRFVTLLPLGGRLVIERTLTPLERGTRFRHDVRFEGFGGAVLSLFLGHGYRAALPGVMERIKVLAEAQVSAR
jgi:uncharacterized protein YndB with AHSA1/START domain